MPRNRPKSYTPSRGLFGGITFPSRYAYRRAHQQEKAGGIDEYLAAIIPPPQPHRTEIYERARSVKSHYSVRNRAEFNALIKHVDNKPARSAVQPRIKINGQWASGYTMAYSDEVEGELERLVRSYGVRIQDVEELELVEVQEWSEE